MSTNQSEEEISFLPTDPMREDASSDQEDSEENDLDHLYTEFNIERATASKKQHRKIRQIFLQRKMQQLQDENEKLRRQQKKTKLQLLQSKLAAQELELTLLRGNGTVTTDTGITSPPISRTVPGFPKTILSNGIDILNSMDPISNYKKFKSEIQTAAVNGHENIDWKSFISRELLDALRTKFTNARLDLNEITYTEFFNFIDKVYVGKQLDATEQIRQSKLPKLDSIQQLTKLFTIYNEIYNSAKVKGIFPPDLELPFVQSIMKKFKSREDQKISPEIEYFGNKIAMNNPQTFEMWKTIADQEFEIILGHHEYVKLCKVPKESGSTPHVPSHNRKRERTENTHNLSEKKVKTDSQGIYPCQGCGHKLKHTGAKCPLAKHPGFNNLWATTTWSDSETGKAYKSRGYSNLRLNQNLDGSKFDWAKQLKNANAIRNTYFKETSKEKAE